MRQVKYIGGVRQATKEELNAQRYVGLVKSGVVIGLFAADDKDLVRVSDLSNALTPRPAVFTDAGARAQAHECQDNWDVGALERFEVLTYDQVQSIALATKQ